MELHDITDPIRGGEYTGVRCSRCRATGRYSTSPHVAIEFWDDRTPSLYQLNHEPHPTNQCAGCCANMELQDGLHFDDTGEPYMVCSRDDYEN